MWTCWGVCVSLPERMQLGPQLDLRPFDRGSQTSGGVPEMGHLSPPPGPFWVTRSARRQPGKEVSIIYIPALPTLLSPPFRAAGLTLNRTSKPQQTPPPCCLPQLTLSICWDGLWHCWQQTRPLSRPSLDSSNLDLNWQAVFLFCNAKYTPLPLVFEHKTKHMCHTQAPRTIPEASLVSWPSL